MEDKAEDPSGYLLLTIFPLVLRLGESGESTSKYSMFVARWPVVSPTKPRMIVIWIEHTVDCSTNMGGWKVIEIGLRREKFAVTLMEISKNVRRWIHDREVRKGVKKAGGRHRCEPLRSLGDYDSAIDDFHAADEDVETIRNEGGVEASQRHHRRKGFESG